MNYSKLTRLALKKAGALPSIRAGNSTFLSGLVPQPSMALVARRKWACQALSTRPRNRVELIGVEALMQRNPFCLSVPIAKPLLKHLDTLPVSDDPQQPLFSAAFELYTKHKFNGALSKQFYAILVAAGLAKERGNTVTGKGRLVRHKQSELTFHCLRHTATSLLKNAGVSDVIARDIIGHESEAVSRAYTHIEMGTKRRALDNMPDVTLPELPAGSLTAA